MYSNKLICDILIYINNNINNKISIADLENRFFYNRYYIMKLFKKEIGLTIIEYINSIKIYNSTQYLKSKNISLLNISLKSGFYSLEYFSETFKQITHVSPSDFRNYFNYKKNVSEDIIKLINKHMIKMYEIKNVVCKYISRQKPSSLTGKKFSIFK